MIDREHNLEQTYYMEDLLVAFILNTLCKKYINEILNLLDLNNNKPLSLFALINGKHIINTKSLNTKSKKYLKLLKLNYLATFNKNLIDYVDGKQYEYNYNFNYFKDKYQEIMQQQNEMSFFDKNREFAKFFNLEINNIIDGKNNFINKILNNENENLITKYNKFYNNNYINLKKQPDYINFSTMLLSHLQIILMMY